MHRKSKEVNHLLVNGASVFSPFIVRKIEYPQGFTKCLYDKVSRKLIFINNKKIIVTNKTQTKKWECNINKEKMSSKIDFCPE